MGSAYLALPVLGGRFVGGGELGELVGFPLAAAVGEDALEQLWRRVRSPGARPARRR